MAERLTKVERREIAREKARKLQAEQEKREKRNRMLMIGGAVLLVLLVALAVWAIVANASKSHLDGVDAPAGADEKGGISIGSSLAAGTVNEGAPVVDVYLDFTCHYCAIFEEINAEDLSAMAEEGLITLKMHPLTLLSTDADGFTVQAANAAATVAEYSPEHFLSFNNALFTAFYEVYNRYIETQDTADYVLPSLAEIGEIASGVGVPQDVVDRFADATYNEWLTASTLQFRADGFSGTPTVIVDGTQLTGEWQEAGAIRAMITGE